MDFELMINSFPKLLNATLITLKLLSASLFFGLFIGLLFAILRTNKRLENEHGANGMYGSDENALPLKPPNGIYQPQKEIKKDRQDKNR